MENIDTDSLRNDIRKLSADIQKQAEDLRKQAERVDKLELANTFLLKGQEAHITSVQEFIRRNDRDRDTIETRTTEIQTDLKKLIKKDDQLEGMKSLFKVQWIALLGVASLLGTAFAAYAAFHH